jgi:hypothetical protein
MTHSLAWYVVGAYKITGPAVFGETNYDHYITLNLTQLFINQPAHAEKKYEIPLSLQRIKE